MRFLSLSILLAVAIFLLSVLTPALDAQVPSKFKKTVSKAKSVGYAAKAEVNQAVASASGSIAKSRMAPKSVKKVAAKAQKSADTSRQKNEQKSVHHNLKALHKPLVGGTYSYTR